VTLAHDSVSISTPHSKSILFVRSSYPQPSSLNFELSTFDSELPPPRLTPFLSYQSKSRIRNSFPLISFQKTGGIPLAWSDQSARIRVSGCRLTAKGFLLTPFPATLTQKQGGTLYWPALSPVEGSYQFSPRQAAGPSLRSVLCALSVSAVSLLLFPFPMPYTRSSLPCPTTQFPLQWEYPFPVITEENQ
jgi:hypothetical protein